MGQFSQIIKITFLLANILLLYGAHNSSAYHKHYSKRHSKVPLNHLIFPSRNYFRGGTPRPKSHKSYQNGIRHHRATKLSNWLTKDTQGNEETTGDITSNTRQFGSSFGVKAKRIRRKDTSQQHASASIRPADTSKRHPSAITAGATGEVSGEWNLFRELKFF